MLTLEAACYRQGDLSLVYTRKFYVTNIFDRVDDIANIFQQLKKLSAALMTSDSRDTWKQGGAAYSLSRRIWR